MTTPATAYGSLLARAAVEGSEPLFTDVDLGAGTRVELSVASAANGAAKAAHLFIEVAEELGRPPIVGWRLPLHWQAATLALGCWGAGGRIHVGDGDDDPARVDVLVLGPEQIVDPSAPLPDLVWTSRLHPFGLPFDQPPPFPLEDLTPLLRAQPDEPPQDRGHIDDLAVLGTSRPLTHADLRRRAEAATDVLGPRDRVLTCLPWAEEDAWALALTLPLMDRRASVLVRGLPELAPVDRPPTLAQLVADERVDLVLGCTDTEAGEP